jgi:hypothetical protein
MTPAIIEYRLDSSFERVFKWRRGNLPVPLEGITATFQALFNIYGENITDKACDMDEEKGDVYVNLSPEEISNWKNRQCLCRILLTYPGGIQYPTAWIILRPKRI